MIRFAGFDFDTRRALAWGTTWAMVVAVCEALAMSPERWASPQLLLWWLTYWVIPFWCAVGALLLWLLNRSERRWGTPGLAGSFFILCPLPAIVQPALSAGLANLTQSALPALQRFALDTGVVPTRESWPAIGLYDLWIYLFYGGLLMAAYLFTVRRERLRSMLHASAMARSRTQGLLDAERLQALQAQIDPALLLQTMRELEQRYRSAPASAESLLEALVEFLRDAMHGLRVPVSTLNAELRLARAFAQLQRERGIAGAWHVVDPTLEGNDLKFPSLLMLPLLALGGSGGRPMLRARSDGARTVLQLLGLTTTVSADLRQQLQARLQTLYGGQFRLDYSAALPTQLSITLEHGLSTEGEKHG
jgi:hypothetical protein